MIRLQDALPDHVTVGGRRYRLDLDFRNVLRMTEILARDDLMPGARAYRALKCVRKNASDTRREAEFLNV